MKEKLVDYWKEFNVIKDKRVLDAFKKILRENFVGDSNIPQSYEDRPLPISCGQTISQPTTVMIMTEALELKKGDKVLEVGAGSGYQAALISEIVGKTGKVVTTEIIPELADFAMQNLKKCSIKNVIVVLHDGSCGYEKETPYDAIIITAAAPEIPKCLIEQLKDGGRLVAPVGPLHSQEMIKLTKKKGKFIEERLGNFVFVPLRGERGY